MGTAASPEVGAAERGGEFFQRSLAPRQESTRRPKGSPSTSTAISPRRSRPSTSMAPWTRGRRCSRRCKLAAKPEPTTTTAACACCRHQAHADAGRRDGSTRRDRAGHRGRGAGTGHGRLQAGTEGVEIKSTLKTGGAVDTHSARDQWMCVFVYTIDLETEPARERRPMAFTEVYLAQVQTNDFRRNERGTRGTRTATLHREGLRKLREHWVYRASLCASQHLSPGNAETL